MPLLYLAQYTEGHMAAGNHFQLWVADALAIRQGQTFLLTFADALRKAAWYASALGSPQWLVSSSDTLPVWTAVPGSFSLHPLQ